MQGFCDELFVFFEGLAVNHSFRYAEFGYTA